MKTSKTKHELILGDFEDGRDLSKHFDFEAGTKVVNIELPIWAIKALDKEATRRGVARQALMKMWLVDRLDVLYSKNHL